MSEVTGLFRGVQELRFSRLNDIAQGAFLDAVMAACGSAGIGEDAADGDQAAPAFRAAAQAAIGVDRRTRTARQLGFERAGEILVCQDAAGANDHGLYRSEACNGPHLDGHRPLVNASDELWNRYKSAV